LNKIIKEILNTLKPQSYNTLRRKKNMSIFAVILILAICTVPAVKTFKKYMDEN